MKNSYAQGLACKVSGYKNASGVGFVFSAAEMKRLDEVRASIADASKNARRAGNLVSAGLGAVALGLVVTAFGGRKK